MRPFQAGVATPAPSGPIPRRTPAGVTPRRRRPRRSGGNRVIPPGFRPDRPLLPGLPPRPGIESPLPRPNVALPSPLPGLPTWGGGSRPPVSRPGLPSAAAAAAPFVAKVSPELAEGRRPELVEGHRPELVEGRPACDLSALRPEGSARGWPLAPGVSSRPWRAATVLPPATSATPGPSTIPEGCDHSRPGWQPRHRPDRSPGEPRPG